MELTSEIKEFIRAHASQRASDLVLKYSGKTNFDIEWAAMQIEARRRAHSKLSRFLQNDNFLFPTLLSAEQATNQDVAQWHATLVSPGERVADLTSGLGIDAMSMAMAGAELTCFERNTAVSEALRHNAAIFSPDLKVIPPCDSIEWLGGNPDVKFDTIFIDPARRASDNKRTYALADCEPDVASRLPLLLAHADRVIIKASPMLDVIQLQRELSQLQSLACVVWHGECKEVLAIVVKGWDGDCALRSATVTSGGEAQIYFCPESYSDEAMLPSGTDVSDMYLYDPDAGVRKLGREAGITTTYPSLMQADRNTRIFFSAERIDSFPGRCLKVVGSIGIKDKSLRGSRMNVVSRNHPLSAEEIIRRCRIVPGGDRWLYALRMAGQAVLLEVV